MFCLLSMKVNPGEEHSLVEKMMLADTQLWKGKKENSLENIKFDSSTTDGLVQLAFYYILFY